MTNRLHPINVAAFVIVRNPMYQWLFNIVALNAKDEIEYVHSIDHMFDDATTLVEVLNAELQPI